MSGNIKTTSNKKNDQQIVPFDVPELRGEWLETFNSFNLEIEKAYTIPESLLNPVPIQGRIETIHQMKSIKKAHQRNIKKINPIYIDMCGTVQHLRSRPIGDCKGNFI